MMLIVLLFLAGVILLGAEIFVPGGVLGVLAAALLLAGVGVAYVQAGPGAALVALVVGLGLVLAMLYVELVWWPQTRWGRQMCLTAQIDGVGRGGAVKLEKGATLVGLGGRTLTPLAPGGYIELEGRRWEAVAVGGMIDRDAAVRVVGHDDFRLRVQPL